MRLGNKKIFHLEAWVVKVMSLYKVRFSRSLWYGPTTVTYLEHSLLPSSAFLFQHRHGRIR